MAAVQPSVPATGEGPDPKRWIALVVIAAAQLMIVLDASIVNIAIPQATLDLDIASADRQWVVTAYTLAFGGLLLLGGRVADYLGRKRTFVVGLLGFAAASAVGGFAWSAGSLYAARGLQGAFAALMAPAALSLISVTFTEPRERAKAFGVFGAVSGGGAAIGLIVGGLLTEYASWRWCLGVNVPISLITAAAAYFVVRESRSTGVARYDVPGAALVTGGLLSLVYGFTEAAKSTAGAQGPEVKGWTAGSTLFFLILAAVLLVSFIIWEMRVDHPLLPLRVALDRNRGGSYLIFLLVGSGMFAMFLFLTFYFQEDLGYSPLRTGFAFLPFSIGVIASAGVVAQLVPRVGPRPHMIFGLSLATVGMLCLTQITADSSYWGWAFWGLILISIGLANVFIVASSTALVGVDSQDAGVASALLNTAQQVGGSLGTALLSTFFASAVTGYIADNATGGPADATLGQSASIHGYHVAFVWGAIFFSAALLVSIFLVNARKDDLPADAMAAAG